MKPLNHRSPKSPIYHIRRGGDLRWAYPLTKLDDHTRRAFFHKCAANISGNTEQEKRLRLAFQALADYGRDALLRMVGDRALLRHCFNWEWFLKYQREWKKKKADPR